MTLSSSAKRKPLIKSKTAIGATSLAALSFLPPDIFSGASIFSPDVVDGVKEAAIDTAATAWANPTLAALKALAWIYVLWGRKAADAYIDGIIKKKK